MCALFIVELQLLEIQVNVLESLIDVLIVLLLFFFTQNVKYIDA